MSQNISVGLFVLFLSAAELLDGAFDKHKKRKNSFSSWKQRAMLTRSLHSALVTWCRNIWELFTGFVQIVASEQADLTRIIVECIPDHDSKTVQQWCAENKNKQASRSCSTKSCAAYKISKSYNCWNALMMK